MRKWTNMPQSGPSCDEGDNLPQCDESGWPDKDHCLVCGAPRPSFLAFRI